MDAKAEKASSMKTHKSKTAKEDPVGWSAGYREVGIN